MIPTVQQLLTAFDQLSAVDREAAVTELLLRNPLGAGPIPDAAFEQLAEDVFLAYDAEEAANAAPAG